MAHILVCGQTMAGKSTMAKHLMAQFKSAGRKILTLDPMGDRDFRRLSDYVTDDPERFLKVASVNTRAVLVIDEGGTTIGRYNTAMEILATQFRHLGHQCLFLVQRPVLIPLTIRANTSAAIVFCVGARDADALSVEYNCPEMKGAPDFPKGRYIYKKRFENPIVGNVFDLPRKIF